VDTLKLVFLCSASTACVVVVVAHLIGFWVSIKEYRNRRE
jgi:hypothetical protein